MNIEDKEKQTVNFTYQEVIHGMFHFYRSRFNEISLENDNVVGLMSISDKVVGPEVFESPIGITIMDKPVNTENKSIYKIDDDRDIIKLIRF